MKVRLATPSDADAISGFLTLLTAAGKRTLPDTANYVRTQYILNPNKICTHVAEDDDGTVLAIQILLRAADNDGYDVLAGLGVIGTHVHPNAARRGIGSALFAATKQWAIAAGLTKIDATIGSDNEQGLAYYSAMGFETYKTTDVKTRKYYVVPASSDSA